MTQQQQTRGEFRLARRAAQRVMPFRAQVTRSATSGGMARIDGYASTTAEPYEMWDFYGSYTEVMAVGAFTETLAASPDVSFLLNHGGLTMARTAAGGAPPESLQLSADSTGLLVAAQVNPARSDVADMLIGIEDGVLNEMSFAFAIARQQWSPDYLQCDVLAVDLHRGDVSVVNYGANPGTSVGVRSQDADRLARAYLAAQRVSSPPADALAGGVARSGLTRDQMRLLELT